MNELLHAAGRGTIAAMAMTGARRFTTDAGLVEETPPRAIFRQRVPGLARTFPRRRRRMMQELCHWGYGAAGGAVFRMLPDGVRRRPYAGPLYGLAVWVGFEMALAPVLGLEQAKRRRLVERGALAADHALYGLVLTETRRVPRD